MVCLRGPWILEALYGTCLASWNYLTVSLARLAPLSVDLLPALCKSHPVCLSFPSWSSSSSLATSTLPVCQFECSSIDWSADLDDSVDRAIVASELLESLSPIMPRLRFKFINSQIISLWLLLVLWTDHVQTINRCRCRSWSFAACESFCQFISCSPTRLSWSLLRLSHFHFTTSSSSFGFQFLCYLFRFASVRSLRFQRIFIDCTTN